MVRLARRRKLAVLILSLALLAPWSAEAFPLDGPHEPSAGIMARLAEWFAVFLGDIGCSMDPSGNCHGPNGSQPSVPGDQPDIGCSADPNGGPCGTHG